MTELQRMIEKVWPLEEPLIIKDVLDATIAGTQAISINDTIGIEWDDKGYGIYNEQYELPVTFGKFDPDVVVMMAIQAYVKHVVDYGLGMLHDIAQEKEDEIGDYVEEGHDGL